MTRKYIPPQPLKLPDLGTNSDHINPNESACSTPSPISPSSKLSGTRSPFKFNSKKLHALAQTSTYSEPPSNPVTGLLLCNSSSLPSQTAVSLSTLTISSTDQERNERRERPSRSSFFNNYKASRSLNRLQIESSKRLNNSGSNMSKDTEKLAGPVSQTSLQKDYHLTDSNLAEFTLDLCSDSPPPAVSSNTNKKTKQKTFSILSRSHSSRDETGTNDLSSDISLSSEKGNSQTEVNVSPVPVEQERSYRSLIASNIRQNSSERIPSSYRDRSREHKNRSAKDSSNSKSQIMANLQKEQNRNPNSVSPASGGNNFLNSLRSQATKGAGALSKGLFGKGTRGGNNIEKPPEIDDENYELKVINLPLVQQTRLTRISKKLEDSRDKTEFWMPAFPWRAIDYLNYKGSDVEGLYRIPGSGPEIKKWRRRFDQELDIDLFEQDDLYDINIIGSMLKAWLRELPDELLPKVAQDRIARECATSEKVPQLLIDELSNLSPFNYYLLFAVTCHLSLLLAHSKKNKMDYRNLCICFQPCMKIDALCFRFLVCEWRDCWKGCKTESFYIEQEYMLFEQAQSIHPQIGSRSSTAQAISYEDREDNHSGSESLKSSTTNEEQTKSQKHNNIHNNLQTHQSGHSWTKISTQSIGPDKKDKNPTRNAQTSSPHSSPRPKLIKSKSSSSICTSTSKPLEQINQFSKKTDDIRPLSPIKPLSPMGF
ncbi:hypothetical protein Golomagni_03258 [Golovinomyces magnicellulatus]|nr:hypothetical protein Golomagni_03258 [Golovinomyces magnicellulatus]